MYAEGTTYLWAGVEEMKDAAETFLVTTLKLIVCFCMLLCMLIVCFCMVLCMLELAEGSRLELYLQLQLFQGCLSSTHSEKWTH